MINTLIAINVIYVLLIIYLIIGVVRICYRKNNTSKKKNKVSVIVAARNEEANIINLLESLEEQTYPKDLFEVLIVDDRSHDNTYNKVQKYIISSNINIKLISINKKDGTTGKKQAVAKGIESAANDILMFTDSDCVVNSKWIETFANEFDDKTDYILGYTHVIFRHKTFLNKLKTFEAIVYRALAASGLGNRTPITASASNMAYRKSVYLKSGGFGRFKHIPSGDDDLQLFNMWVNLRNVKYLTSSDSQISTIEKESTSAHANLETRRASKFKYHPKVLQLFSIFMFMYFISLGYMIYSALIASMPISIFMYIIISKVFIELLYLGYFSYKIKRLRYLWCYFAFMIVYILIFVIFAINGTLGKYKWKN